MRINELLYFVMCEVNIVSMSVKVLKILLKILPSASLVYDGFVIHGSMYYS